ncbi:MAG: alternative ribosome rescue aminoacyl-tRNA hydrolase ArfB [Acetobacteraceae bacterium]
MIPVTATIALDEAEVQESFLRASGAGGQNIQKVETAVQLRFDVRGSSSLPDDVRERLVHLAGRRLTREGILVITAQRHRTQQRNRDDALARLLTLIRAAAIPPQPRMKTRPTAASRRRRLEAKARRAATKRDRADPSGTC